MNTDSLNTPRPSSRFSCGLGLLGVGHGQFYFQPVRSGVQRWGPEDGLARGPGPHASILERHAILQGQDAQVKVSASCMHAKERNRNIFYLIPLSDLNGVVWRRWWKPLSSDSAPTISSLATLAHSLTFSWPGRRSWRHRSRQTGECRHIEAIMIYGVPSIVHDASNRLFHRIPGTR